MERIQLEITYAANKLRQETAQKLIDYYNGKQLEHLSAVLDAQFASPDALKLQLAMDNLVQFVADEISRVFDQAPVLTSENATAQAFLDEVTTDGLLATILKTGEVYANLTGVCGLHPWFDSAEQKIKTTLIPSSALFVAQRRDDPTEAEAVVYIREVRDTITAALTEEFIHWDAEWHFLLDANSPGSFRPPSPDNPEMVNPYGIIPFAWLRDQMPIGTFFTECDEGLANAQETLNVLLTSANQLAK